MMDNRIIPNLEVEPRVYALHWKIDQISNIDNGKVMPYHWVDLNQFVSYTYEGAIAQLRYELENRAEHGNLKIHMGNLKIIDYSSWTIKDIFNKTYEMYGEDEYCHVDEDEVEC